MVGSICGDAGGAGNTPYSASKSAMNGLVLPMARDLGPLGIRAMTVAAGSIVTPMHEKYRVSLGVDPETWAGFVKGSYMTFPLGGMGEPDNFSHWV